MCTVLASLRREPQKKNTFFCAPPLPIARRGRARPRRHAAEDDVEPQYIFCFAFVLFRFYGCTKFCIVVPKFNI